MTLVSLSGAESGVWKAVSFVAVLFLPSFYLSRLFSRDLGLEVDEAFVMNLFLNVYLLMFTYIYLSMLSIQVTGSLVLGVQSAFCLVSIPLTRTQETMSIRIESPDKIVLKSIGMMLCFMIGFIVVSYVIPTEHWRGLDPWETVTIVKAIKLHSFSPSEAVDYFFSFVHLDQSGFYYFVAALSEVTSVDVPFMMRYGGLFSAGLCSVITYIYVKRTVNPFAGLLSSLLIFANPYMVQRFAAPMRENLSFYALILVLFLLQRRKESGIHGGGSAFIAVAGLLIGASIVTHPLVTLFVVGVLAFDAARHYLNGRIAQLKETLLAAGLGCVLASPYLHYLYYPLKPFIGESNLIPFSIAVTGLGLASVLSLRYRREEVNGFIARHGPILMKGFVAAAAVAFIHTLLVPRDFPSSFGFSDLSQDMFASNLLLLSLFGFITLPASPVPAGVVVVTSILWLSMAATNLGFALPLDRLVIYMTWVQTFFFALFIERFAGFKASNHYQGTGVKELCSYALESIKNNRAVIAVLILVVSSTVVQVNGYARSQVDFTYDDVHSARLFVRDLEEDDLVLPIGITDRLLYYVDAPRENMVTDVDEHEWVTELFRVSSPYEFTSMIHERYPDVQRVHVFGLTKDRRVQPRTLLNYEMLAKYAEEKEYRTVVTYTLPVPFALDGVPLQKVKEVGDVKPLFDNAAEWVSHVTSLSNVLYDEATSRFLQFFSVGEMGSRDGLTLTFSSDGASWVGAELPIIAGSYRSPYIVQGECYELFCEDVAAKTIVRFTSEDLIDWSGPHEVLDAPVNGQGSAGSPVVWVENSGWYMMYEQRNLDGDDFGCTLKIAESADGQIWATQDEELEWLLNYVSVGAVFDAVRVLPSDIIVLDEGYLLLGRVLVGDGQGYQETTATFFLDGSLRNRVAEFQPIDFGDDHVRVDSLHVARNPVTRETVFYFVESTGEVGYARMGAISDTE
ncbi:hypothetical protein JXL21_12970 [Candidatus Bathyarchaeota archaeon]|nr:hypothetical protein [Candidatus Bathyarchaeota archaeon]